MDSVDADGFNSDPAAQAEYAEVVLSMCSDFSGMTDTPVVTSAGPAVGRLGAKVVGPGGIEDLDAAVVARARVGAGRLSTVKPDGSVAEQWHRARQCE